MLERSAPRTRRRSASAKIRRLCGMGGNPFPRDCPDVVLNPGQNRSASPVRTRRSSGRRCRFVSFHFGRHQGLAIKKSGLTETGDCPAGCQFVAGRRFVVADLTDLSDRALSIDEAGNAGSVPCSLFAVVLRLPAWLRRSGTWPLPAGPPVVFG